MSQPISREEFGKIFGPASMHAIGHVAANISFAAVAIRCARQFRRPLYVDMSAATVDVAAGGGRGRASGQVGTEDGNGEKAPVQLVGHSHPIVGHSSAA
jgi:hypothetical protein